MIAAAKSEPVLLAIETSCDETAVAILRGNELLASEVASQAEHEAYGGVVPEVASRNHLLHAPRLLGLALQKAGIALEDVDAFAATSGPGLASSLMIGASMAKGLALGTGRPYLAINHLEGHLLSPFLWTRSAIPATTEIKPNVSLIVSGGHTLLVEVRGVGDYRILGRTVDDAAGEAFDKVAKLLGLGYPGGPEIEKRAITGNGARFNFPRSMLDSGDYNFSFSGLKTAVRYRLADFNREQATPELVNDMCASFQRAVVEVLVKKTLRAATECGASLVTLSGGVSCNEALRSEMAARCREGGLRLLTAPSRLCTDNAAMIAFAAALRFHAGFRSAVSEEIDPNLALVRSG
ncbi:MAG: tRNA (adenosine(37)-N6)-threonylcarbamoyltransferase complex transferase subunit TsaD [Verrucomicrobiota bacterium]|nr:tRNA (adenosine(37)-N6)-threonylcarbamoyltransferase complex transferase subunit TsaD [Verrucomicrobiota bacterium]